MSEHTDELEKAYQDGYLSCDDIVNAPDPFRRSVATKRAQAEVDRVLEEIEAGTEREGLQVLRALRMDAERNARLDRLKEWAWIALAASLAGLLAWLIVR